ncbi:hypothetical protein [Microbacterium lushaniae]|uniref:Uncharacterized protein n=1 Tax=Microbacterium lushaniae TaxID=2614639 RepID=A0A5J6L0K8_9MICO|nr:hypothetical protein [Microbacterium lushaniae]QEW01916.1 hypothetical protein F6J85_01575 [Microbacterium lushaniae]
MTESGAVTAGARHAPSGGVRDEAAVLLAVGAVILGLLPWLATGLRLPLQNLWLLPTAPEDMPLVLLPFSQYSLVLIFAVLVVGAAVAGVVTRSLRNRLSRRGRMLLFGIVPALQLIAIVQTAVAVRSGLAETGQAAVYLAALVGVSALSVLIGMLCQTLIAVAPRAGALLGLTIAAVAASSWIGGFLQPFTLYGPDWLLPVVGLIAWVAPLLTGLAIAWTGVSSPGRVVAALASLIVVWVAPAAITGVSSAAGSRVLASDPAAMIEYALQVFASALLTPELALRPIVATVLVAAIGLAARWTIRRRRARPSATP